MVVCIDVFVHMLAIFLDHDFISLTMQGIQSVTQMLHVTQRVMRHIHVITAFTGNIEMIDEMKLITHIPT